MPPGGVSHGRAVQAILAARKPAPVRQSELPALRRTAVGCRALRRRPGPVRGWVCVARLRTRPVRRRAVRPRRVRGTRQRRPAGVRRAMGHGRSAVRHRGPDDLARHRAVVGERIGHVGDLAPGDRAERWCATGRRAVSGRGGARYRAAGWRRGVDAAVVAGGQVPLGLPGMRWSWRPEPLWPGRHLAGPAGLVTVVAAFGGPGLVLGGKCLVGGVGGYRTLGRMAAPVTLMPGWTVRVTAEAAVATLHLVPPAVPQHSSVVP